MKYASAEDQLTAAERVAHSLSLRARAVDNNRQRQMEDRQPQTTERKQRQHDRLMDMVSDIRERLDELEEMVTAADE